MPDDTPSMERLFNRKEAAAYLTEKMRGHISVHTLAQLRTAGPRYRYFRGNRLSGTGGGYGRWVVYTQQALDEWAAAQLSEPPEYSNGRTQSLASAS